MFESMQFVQGIFMGIFFCCIGLLIAIATGLYLLFRSMKEEKKESNELTTTEKLNELLEHCQKIELSKDFDKQRYYFYYLITELRHEETDKVIPVEYEGEYGDYSFDNLVAEMHEHIQLVVKNRLSNL